MSTVHISTKRLIAALGKRQGHLLNIDDTCELAPRKNVPDKRYLVAIRRRTTAQMLLEVFAPNEAEAEIRGLAKAEASNDWDVLFDEDYNATVQEVGVTGE